jgi:hypothetical protein
MKFCWLIVHVFVPRRFNLCPGIQSQAVKSTLSRVLIPKGMTKEKRTVLGLPVILPSRETKLHQPRPDSEDPCMILSITKLSGTQDKDILHSI